MCFCKIVADLSYDSSSHGCNNLVVVVGMQTVCVLRKQYSQLRELLVSAGCTNQEAESAIARLWGTRKDDGGDDHSATAVAACEPGHR